MAERLYDDIVNKLKDSKTSAQRTLLGAEVKVRTFAIMSPENPFDQELTREENDERCKRFENSLKSSRIEFTWFSFGFYGKKKENSALLRNVSRKEVLDFGMSKELGQQAVIFGIVNGSQNVTFEYWSRKQPDHQFKLADKVENFDVIWKEKDPKNYTRLKSWAFRIPFDVDKIETVIDYPTDYYAQRYATLERADIDEINRMFEEIITEEQREKKTMNWYFKKRVCIDHVIKFTGKRLRDSTEFQVLEN